MRHFKADDAFHSAEANVVCGRVRPPAVATAARTPRVMACKFSQYVGLRRDTHPYTRSRATDSQVQESARLFVLSKLAVFIESFLG